MKPKYRISVTILIVISIVLLSLPACAPRAGELVVVARLVRIADAAPHCGIMHFGSLAEYADVKAVSGDYRPDKLFVVHGCIELERERYATDSGTLAGFTVGDYHRLTLTNDNVHKVGTIIKGPIDPGTSPVYYCRRVDKAQ